MDLFVDGRGSKFEKKNDQYTRFVSGSCPDTDHVRTQEEQDRCGVSTCGIIEEKESRIHILGTSSCRK